MYRFVYPRLGEFDVHWTALLPALGDITPGRCLVGVVDTDVDTQLGMTVDVQTRTILGCCEHITEHMDWLDDSVESCAGLFVLNGNQVVLFHEPMSVTHATRRVRVVEPDEALPQEQPLTAIFDNEVFKKKEEVVEVENAEELSEEMR